MALALWLPRYVIDAYGFDIRTAGLIGAAHSVLASIFRACGGVRSDRYGARRVMYWTFGVSVAWAFLLSYPATDYVVQGIRGPTAFRLESGIWTFIPLVFVLGFFMSLGKAAVFKHIPAFTTGGLRQAGTVAAVLALQRLSRRHGLRTLGRPIPGVLHLAYLMLPVALAVKAAHLLGGTAWASGWLHLQAIGAVSLMILAVMPRATLGHTGRPLVASRAMLLAWALLPAAALVRVFGPTVVPGLLP